MNSHVEFLAESLFANPYAPGKNHIDNNPDHYVYENQNIYIYIRREKHVKEYGHHRAAQQYGER